MEALMRSCGAAPALLLQGGPEVLGALLESCHIHVAQPLLWMCSLSSPPQLCHTPQPCLQGSLVGRSCLLPEARALVNTSNLPLHQKHCSKAQRT